MANGENLQSQDQNLNNETSSEEVINNQNPQDSSAEKPAEKPELSQTESSPADTSSGDQSNIESDPPKEETKTEEVNVSAEETEANNADSDESKSEDAEPSDENAEKQDTEKSDVDSEEDKSKEEVKEDKTLDEAKEKKEKEEENKEKFDELFNTLKQKKENNETIKVKVLKKIRGGLRVLHDDMPIFLPASHFSIRRSPKDQDINAIVGKEIDVHIHELSEEEETGRKTVIVTRKKILKDEFWKSINVGDEVEGVVSSIAPFGVFLDIGGFEGLIHVSRLSQSHVDHPKNVCKKGDKMKAVVVDINKEKERIALSRQEFEESPWQNIEEEFPKGTVVKGKVKRLTDFGAYVELKEGIDGLLRTNEISWTERIRKPSDVLNPGDEIDVEVMNSNPAKRTAALSHRRTIPNPWNDLKERFKIGTELKGKIKQIVSQGAVVTIEENIDGFLPKSKILNLDKGKKIPYNVDEEIDIKIADLVPENESLIFAPVYDEDEIKEYKKRQATQQSQPKRRQGGGGQGRPKQVESSNEDSAFTFMDLLSDQEKSDLSKINK